MFLKGVIYGVLHFVLGTNESEVIRDGIVIYIYIYIYIIRCYYSRKLIISHFVSTKIVEVGELFIVWVPSMHHCIRW